MLVLELVLEVEVELMDEDVELVELLVLEVLAEVLEVELLVEVLEILVLVELMLELVELVLIDEVEVVVPAKG